MLTKEPNQNCIPVSAGNGKRYGEQSKWSFTWEKRIKTFPANTHTRTLDDLGKCVATFFLPELCVRHARHNLKSPCNSRCIYSHWFLYCCVVRASPCQCFSSTSVPSSSSSSFRLYEFNSFLFAASIESVCKNMSTRRHALCVIFVMRRRLRFSFLLSD